MGSSSDEKSAEKVTQEADEGNDGSRKRNRATSSKGKAGHGEDASGDEKEAVPVKKRPSTKISKGYEQVAADFAEFGDEAGDQGEETVKKRPATKKQKVDEIAEDFMEGIGGNDDDDESNDGAGESSVRRKGKKTKKDGEKKQEKKKDKKNKDYIVFSIFPRVKDIMDLNIVLRVAACRMQMQAARKARVANAKM